MWNGFYVCYSDYIITLTASKIIEKFYYREWGNFMFMSTKSKLSFLFKDRVSYSCIEVQRESLEIDNEVVFNLMFYFDEHDYFAEGWVDPKDL